MKQLGNLANVCARRKGVLLQVLDGTVTVHVGEGLDRRTLGVSWDADDQINRLIHKLNFVEFSEKGDVTHVT